MAEPEAAIFELGRRPVVRPRRIGLGCVFKPSLGAQHVEHLLRNMGITTLVVSGIFTNSSVEGTTRDAGDRDFRVLLAEDACAAMSAVGHRNALDYLDANFCHVKSTEEILALLGVPAAAATRCGGWE